MGRGRHGINQRMPSWSSSSCKVEVPEEVEVTADQHSPMLVVVGEVGHPRHSLFSYQPCFFLIFCISRLGRVELEVLLEVQGEMVIYRM